MKPKTVISVLIVCFVLILLFVLGSAKKGGTVALVQGITAGSDTATSSLVASEISYDFGTISMKNGNVSRDFVLTNSANNDLTIRGLETSCMCTTAFLVEPDGSTKGPFGMPGMGGMTAMREMIPAGGSRTVRVIYDPNAHGPAGVGAIDRFVTITENSGAKLQLEIKAVVTP
jgi:hypothetical protein